MRPGPFRLLLALLLLQMPWLARPVNFDETNFLALATHAAVDPWRPHDVAINWQGVTESAFDVLSNPPGIAWWLAPVAHAPIWVQRAWMLPWLAVMVAGAWRLGTRYVGKGESGGLLLLTSPIVVLSVPALLPDAPLYATVLLGVAGFMDATDEDRNPVPWAVLAGSAALFRYSGITVLPLLVLWCHLRGRSVWPALYAALPIVALALHDLHAYGEWHFLAMTKFQSVATTPADIGHKLIAAVAMLGGAVALPIFPWTRQTCFAAGLGFLLGLAWGVPGAIFTAAGAATLFRVLRTEPDRRFLALWAIGGLCFLVSLRFVATRYWLPFLPAILLAWPAGVNLRWVVGLHTCLAMLLAADDYQSAVAVRRMAREVGAVGTGVFTGHWGWQHALEAQGWTPLDAGARAPPGALVAIPRQAWPQGIDVPCTEVVWQGVARPPIPWLPRGYSERGAANLHANWIAGDPPVRTIAPWTFANDPYERARICRD